METKFCVECKNNVQVIEYHNIGNNRRYNLSCGHTLLVRNVNEGVKIAEDIVKVLKPDPKIGGFNIESTIGNDGHPATRIASGAGEALVAPEFFLSSNNPITISNSGNNNVITLNIVYNNNLIDGKYIEVVNNVKQTLPIDHQPKFLEMLGHIKSAIDSNNPEGVKKGYQKLKQEFKDWSEIVSGITRLVDPVMRLMGSQL